MKKKGNVYKSNLNALPKQSKKYKPCVKRIKIRYLLIVYANVDHWLLSLRNKDYLI